MEAKELKTLEPGEFIRQAIDSGATVEVLEKLLTLQERWEANQAKKAFDAAMADVRKDLPEIVKTRKADFGQGRARYRYEDLAEIVDSLSPVMAVHGLSFRWKTESQDAETVRVTCIISHRGGHYEETSLIAGHDHSGNKNDIQSIGSAVTYLQRYTLKAAIGIAAGEDDDGQQQARRDEPPLRQPSQTHQHVFRGNPLQCAICHQLAREEKKDAIPPQKDESRANPEPTANEDGEAVPRKARGPNPLDFIANSTDEEFTQAGKNWLSETIKGMKGASDKDKTDILSAWDARFREVRAKAL